VNKDLLNDLQNYWFNFKQKDLEFSDDSFENSIIYTYGFTPIETFNQVIEKTKRPKRFIVLGSSIGWQCFFWNSLFPDIPVIGYEIHEFRYDYSCFLAEKYNLNNITLICDSLENAEILEGDLVWENNLCMEDDIIDELNWKILTRIDEIQIVSYRTILSEHTSNESIFLLDVHNKTKIINQKTYIHPVSWTEKQPFYII
jgi:hypothetical protein